jgi:hypothetical protein
MGMMMSVLTSPERVIDREIEETLTAAIRRLIHEALEAADDPERVESVCEEWEELLRDFRALERECLLPRKPSAEELTRHKVIYQQVVSLAGLLSSAVERVHRVSWNLDAKVRDLLQERLALLGRQKYILLSEYIGWHGPMLSPAQLELAKRVLCVPV